MQKIFMIQFLEAELSFSRANFLNINLSNYKVKFRASLMFFLFPLVDKQATNFLFPF